MADDGKVRATTDISQPHEQVGITFDATIAPPIRALECFASGTVVVVDVNGNQRTWTVSAGKQIGLQIQKVASGGTLTADQLLGLR